MTAFRRRSLLGSALGGAALLPSPALRASSIWSRMMYVPRLAGSIRGS